MCKYGNFKTTRMVNTRVPKFKELEEEAIKELWTGSEPLIATCIVNSLTDETASFAPPTVENVADKAVEVEWKRGRLEENKK